MRNKSKTSSKDGIIFILTIVLLYTWFISFPNKKASYKEACLEYIDNKNDKSVSINDYFDAVDSFSSSENNDGWIR